MQRLYDHDLKGKNSQINKTKGIFLNSIHQGAVHSGRDAHFTGSWAADT